MASRPIVRRPDGLVDLTPDPPLDVPTHLLPATTANRWKIAAALTVTNFSVKKAKDKGDALRDAMLAAAGAAGPDAIARAGEGGKENRNENQENRQKNVSAPPPFGYEDHETREAAVAAHAAVLTRDASRAMRERKYVKAEVFLRQLLDIAWREAAFEEEEEAEAAAREKEEAARRRKKNKAAAAAAAAAASGRPSTARASNEEEEEEDADADEEIVDPPAAAPVLYRLAQAVGKQRGRRKEEAALLLRALRSIEAASGSDAAAADATAIARADADAVDAADAADAEMQMRYRVLCALHASHASNDVDDGGLARAYAERALYVAARAKGPWHPQTADEHYRVASARVRAGCYAEAERSLSRALAIRVRTDGERHRETGRVLCALAQARSISRWSPYDPVRVVNAVP